MPLDDTSIIPAQHVTIGRCVSLGISTALQTPGGVDLQVHPRVSLDPALNCGTQAAGCHPLREIPIDELTCADCPVGGWWRPRAWATLGGTGRPVAGEWCGGLQLHSGMIGSEAGDPAAAHELLQDLLRVDPEALQKVGVLVGIDLVGKLLRCLTGLV